MTNDLARTSATTQHERFQRGKLDGFTDWWTGAEFKLAASDGEYLRGYAFGWEMASDPLHEDGHDPHLAPAPDTPR